MYLHINLGVVIVCFAIIFFLIIALCFKYFFELMKTNASKEVSLKELDIQKEALSEYFRLEHENLVHKDKILEKKTELNKMMIKNNQNLTSTDLYSLDDIQNTSAAPDGTSSVKDNVVQMPESSIQLRK